MKKILGLFLFIFSFFLAGLAASHAVVSCQPIYGGGQSCVTTDLAVRKTVTDPSSAQAVPGQVVTFKITVSNTGSTNLSRIVIRDTFPQQFLNFQSGPGTFDPNTKTLTFETQNLPPSQSREFTIQGKVVDAGQLTENVTCVFNQVNAVSDSMQAAHNAQVCIQKQVVTKGGLPVLPPPKVVVTPPTGPELLPLISLLPAGLGGWFLRRNSGGKK